MSAPGGVSERRGETRPAGRARASRYAFAALMLTVAAVFWRALFTSDVLFFRDITSLHYAHAFELRELVRGGHWPLWNPFEHFGEPVASNPVYLLFYPTTWLAWLLPAAYGFKLHYIIHFFVAAAGSFLLARRAGMGPLACYAAGALFVFSGPVMSLGNFVNFLPAAALIPFVVLAADSLARRGGWRAAGLFAGALALQFFAGEPLSTIAAAALAAGWVFAAYGDWRGPLGAPANRVLVRRLAFGMLLAAGLAAIQLLPAAWHARLTQRAAELSYQHGLFWSFHPLKIVELLIPEFWGNPLFDSTPWLYIEGPYLYLMLSVFVGIIPLVFAFLGVISRRDRLSLFWAAGGLAAFLLALGRFTPLGEVFFRLIPIFQVVRFPVKFLVPVALAVAQLAAMGLDHFSMRPLAGGANDTPRPTSRIGRLLGFGLAALAVLWVSLSVFMAWFPRAANGLMLKFAAWSFAQERVPAIAQTLPLTKSQVVEQAAAWLMYVIPGRLPYVLASLLFMALLLGTAGRVQAAARRRIALCAMAAGILQLISTHYSLNPVVSRRFFEDRSPALSLLNRAPSTLGPHRIFAESPNPLSLPAQRAAIDIAQADFLPPSAQVPYMLRIGLQVSAPWDGLATSFAVDPERFLPSPQEWLNDLAFTRGLRGEALARLLRLSSVENALLVHFDPAPGLELLGTARNGALAAVKVYRVEAALPRAFLVHEAVPIAAGSRASGRLLSPEFDPARQVLLNGAGASLAARGAPAQGQEQAKVTTYTPTHIEIEVQASASGFLVFNDSYDPDWQAEVDGAPAGILRANDIFRAVPLAAGQHRVVFRYRPLALYLGAAISALTALLVLACLCVTLRDLCVSVVKRHLRGLSPR